MFSSVMRPLCWLTGGLALVAIALGVYASRGAPASAAPALAPAQEVAEENPRVKPGLVNWHASFADAQTAAQKSGKPVLLLHMMGQLDRQFC